MSRPFKKRRLEALPRAVLYEPLRSELIDLEPREIAIEDFEVMRLVDGHGMHIETAAEKLGVSRSTAGRMLKRCRRAMALGVERRAPLYLDASGNLDLNADAEMRQPSPGADASGGLAFAVMEPSPDALVARVFGRAELFMVYRGTPRKYECIENPGATAGRAAGMKAVTALKEAGVDRVLAGRFGPEALKALGAAGIETFLASGLTVKRACEIYSKVESNV